MKAGYRPETVHLPYAVDDPAQRDLLAAACMKLRAEMLAWSSGQARETQRFDGRIL